MPCCATFESCEKGVHMNAVSALLVDLDKCIGCYDCLVGCHIWHKVKEDKRVEMVILDPVQVNGVLKADYFPLMTPECDLCASKPEKLCADLCPTGALIPCDKETLVTLLNGAGRYIVSKVSEELCQLGKRI